MKKLLKTINKGRHVKTSYYFSLISLAFRQLTIWGNEISPILLMEPYINDSFPRSYSCDEQNPFKYNRVIQFLGICPKETDGNMCKGRYQPVHSGSAYESSKLGAT